MKKITLLKILLITSVLAAATAQADPHKRRIDSYDNGAISPGIESGAVHGDTAEEARKRRYEELAALRRRSSNKD